MKLHTRKKREREETAGTQFARTEEEEGMRNQLPTSACWMKSKVGAIDPSNIL